MKTFAYQEDPLPGPLIPLAPRPAACALPLFAHRIPAGFPSPAEEYLDGTLDLNTYLVRNKVSTFFFRVVGDSMIHAHIFDGDILAADRSIDPKHRHIVVASVNREFTVKRLYRRAGIVELRPENPAYAPLRIEEGDEMVIWGVVTGVVRRFAV